jgi:hypothetical protein
VESEPLTATYLLETPPIVGGVFVCPNTLEDHLPNNGELDAVTLRVLPGFLPYAARSNFRAVTTADQSNLVLASIYTDAVNMAADFERDMHQPLTYAEAYRPGYVQDWRIEEHKHGGPLAAPVVNGEHTSNHGLGLCKDYRNGIGNGPGSTTYQWMHDHAHEYGYVEDVNGEHWHWHHPSTTSITRPRTTPASTGTETLIPVTEEDEDMSCTYAVAKNDSSDPRFGKIKKGWPFVIDHGNHTVRRILIPNEVTVLNLGVMKGKDWVPVSGNVFWELVTSGKGKFKRVNW